MNKFTINKGFSCIFTKDYKYDFRIGLDQEKVVCFNIEKDYQGNSVVDITEQQKEHGHILGRVRFAVEDIPKIINFLAHVHLMDNLKSNESELHNLKEE